MDTKLNRPLDDPDSIFVAVDPSMTEGVMSALRAKKIQFDVSVNPDPPEDESECDVFWFWKHQDPDGLQAIIDEAMKD